MVVSSVVSIRPCASSATELVVLRLELPLIVVDPVDDSEDGVADREGKARDEIDGVGLGALLVRVHLGQVGCDLVEDGLAVSLFGLHVLLLIKILMDIKKVNMGEVVFL